jgi:hypothetical protein
MDIDYSFLLFVYLSTKRIFVYRYRSKLRNEYLLSYLFLHTYEYPFIVIVLIARMNIHFVFVVFSKTNITIRLH